jgi:hypothetical protein
MNLDFKKLKEAIHDIHRELKAQKGDGPSGPPTLYRLAVIKQQTLYNELRAKEKNWPLEAYKKLEIMRDTKKYATILYAIKAHHRGKIHTLKRRNPYFEAPNFIPYDHKTGKPKERQPKFIYPTLTDQEKLIEMFVKEYEAQVETV